MQLKAIPIEIYKHNCENYSSGGLSSKYDELLLLCDDGYIDIDIGNPPENLVVLTKREFNGRESSYIQPYSRPDRGYSGWYFGGCYAGSSDSRFTSMRPIYGATAIHDRQERSICQNGVLSKCGQCRDC